MNTKLKAAIIGGLVVGLLSAIPFINWLNICCCLWAIIGGALASMVYIRNSPTAAGAGDGAVLGVLAGLIGSAIFIILGIPISIAMGSAMIAIFGKIVESLNPDQAEMMRRQMEASQTMLGAIINGLVTAILLVVFSTIGGLIGVPIFERRKGTGNMPPPPPDFPGGQPGGSYGSTA